MSKRKPKVPASIVREVQKELGFDKKESVSHWDIANRIAEKLGWPPIGEVNKRKMTKAYILRYVKLKNQEIVCNPVSNVYFVQAGKMIKIGVADDIKKRITSLQSGNHMKMRLIAHIPAKSRSHAFDIEANLHKRFSSFRTLGEWFSYRMIVYMLDIEEYIVWNGKNHAQEIYDLKMKKSNERMSAGIEKAS